MEVWMANLDLGKKLEVWISGGGYSATSDLDLGKKLEVWIRGGGYSATSDLDLGKKLEIWMGGYSVNVMEKEKNQNNIKILLSTQSRG